VCSESVPQPRPAADAEEEEDEEKEACTGCCGALRTSCWEVRNDIRGTIGFKIARFPAPRVRAKFWVKGFAYASHAAFVDQGWGVPFSRTETRPTTKKYKQTSVVRLLDQQMLDSFLNFDDSSRVKPGMGAACAVRQQGGAVAVVTRVVLTFTRKGETLNRLETRCKVEFDYAIVNAAGNVRLDNAFILRERLWNQYDRGGGHGHNGEIPVPDALHHENLLVYLKATVNSYICQLRREQNFKHIVAGIYYPSSSSSDDESD
jgi:hypothetical protein